eukprot:SAG11_NODE_30645_length_299_cov_0.625000_1_plen_20_part_10
MGRVMRCVFGEFVLDVAEGF